MSMQLSKKYRAKSSAPQDFRDVLRRRGNQEYRALNQLFAEMVERAFRLPEPERYTVHEVLNDEYVRQSTLLDQLYRNEGSILGMGNDESFQIGFFKEEDDEIVDDRSNVPPSLIEIGYPMRQVRTGGVHSLALSCYGVPYSWGSNDKGALGRPTENDRQERLPMPVTGFVRTDTGAVEDGALVSIAAGDLHSLFLSESGAVYQCGAYLDKDYQFFRDMKGPQGTVLGKNFSPVHVHQIPGGEAIAIFAGSASVNAAILTDHSLVTWGLGNCGELARSAGMTNTKADGTYDVGSDFIYKKELDEKGEWVKSNEPDEDIVKEHFLKPKHVLWQSNPHLKRSVLSVAIGVSHLVVAARDPGEMHAHVYTSGGNGYGQLGHGDVGSGAEHQRHALTLVEALRDENIGQVAAGADYTLALSHDRKCLYSFGRADYGQLGIGYIEKELDCRPLPQQVIFPELVKILEVVAGEKNVMARTEENELYTWGFNEEGNTGHTTTNQQDVFFPRKLDVMEHIRGDDVSHCHILGFSSGSQHSLMIAKFFRKIA